MKRLLTIFMLLLILVALVSCGDSTGTGSNENEGTQGEGNQNGGNENQNGGNENQNGGEGTQAVEHKLTVKNEGGAPLDDLRLFIYGDTELSDLIAFGETNVRGEATFSIAEGSYWAVIYDAPEGYLVSESYQLEGTDEEIILETELIEEDFEDKYFDLGSVVPNMTIVKTNGEAVTLSQIFESGKEAIMLNFWYTGCMPCRMEFPFIEEAYSEYSDRVEILALDCYGEANETVAEFQEQNGYSFIMTTCVEGLIANFGGTAYPTSVIIDRYGVICLVETGMLTSAEPLMNAFEYFTGDGYEQVLFDSFEEIPSQG